MRRGFTACHGASRERGAAPGAVARGRHAWARLLAGGLAALAVVLASSPPAAAAEDPGNGDAVWRLRNEDPASGTRVWLRDRPGALPAFRVTTTITARLTSLAAVLLDATRTHEWVYRTREAVQVEADGPLHGVSLVVTAMPWPLSDREAVVVWQMTQDPQTLAITMAGHGEPTRLPPQPGRVRMPSFESRWQLVPRADGRVDVLFEGHGDPGGSLARPPLRDFLATAVWEGPWHTVTALREIVQRPVYAQAELPFLREPGR